MKSTLLCLLATTTAALVAPTSPHPLIRAPARRLAAPALAAAAEDELPASERPGNYVDPYSMALGVSVSAVLCSELVPQTSALAVSGAHLWLGRVAACSGLPLLVANPDEVRPDGKDSPMPGRLAQRYRELGAADIRLVGKPHPLIYEACRARLAASGIEGGRIAAVGDSLHHDVLGASDNGVDSVFI